MTEQRIRDTISITIRNAKRNRGLHLPRVGRQRMWAAFVIMVGWMLLGLPAPGQAQTIMHELTWAHAQPNGVQRFVVFVSPVAGDRAQARQIDVGKPPGEPNSGAIWYSAVISAERDEFVAVAAMASDGSLSGLSRWSGLPPSPPGQPLLIP